ncbi:MAG: transposase [Burkholderiaceae bacterium]
MARYRRNFVPGGTYFFTVISARRIPFFGTESRVAALRDAVREVRVRWPFEIVAWVVLPDHLHCVWRLPPEDADYPRRWAQIKRLTGQRLAVLGLWQRGYWEHTIRDDKDLARHVDYVHWNPVKHGYVLRALDWPWSSFHRAVRLGLYPKGWGLAEDTFAGDGFGE